MDNPQVRLGEDVVALIGGAQEWAKRTFGDLGEAYPHTGSNCPAAGARCASSLALVRGERPEVAEKLVVAASAIADVFRALVAPAEPAGDDEAKDEDDEDGPESHVQHISLAGVKPSVVR